MSIGGQIKGEFLAPQAHVKLVSSDTELVVPNGVNSITVESNGSTSIQDVKASGSAGRIKIRNTSSAAITFVDDTGNLNNVSGNRAIGQEDEIVYERRKAGDTDLWEVRYTNIA